MDVKLCRICAKQDDNFVHIFQTDGLKNKIETCLPIIVTQHCPLPDTICTDCLETVNNFCTFIERCLRNIAVLETQYDVLESCLLAKRKVDQCVSVDVCDLLLVNSAAVDTYTDEIVPSENVPVLGSLVNYECSSSSDTENEDEDTITVDSVKQEKDTTCENEMTVSGRQSVHGKDIIDEIVQRKHLKRKHTDPVANSSGGSAPKVPRIETVKVSSESSSRRKNKQPKKVEYHHLGARLDEPVTNATSAVTCDSFYTANDVLPHLPAEISVTREIDGEVQRPTATNQSDGSTHTCLLCEQRLTGLIALASHMYETHGIDLAQVYSHTSTVPPLPVLTPAPQHTSAAAVCNKTRKIPELVKISDVLSARINKQKHTTEPKHPTTVISTYTDEPPPVLEAQPQQDRRTNSTGAAMTNNQFSCTECTEPVTFSSFREYTTHRRAHHQIFHCDLCPKFYGRNSHLWKHVNRVHKGHPSITCQQCHKTSASEYHLAQHFNKMHSAKPQHHAHYATSNNRQQVASVKIKTEPVNNTVQTDEANELDGDDEMVAGGGGVMAAGDDEDDLLNQKFQGFDFKSVRQSFLRQELMMNKRHKYVSILKKKNSAGDTLADAMGSKRGGNKNNMSGAANNNTANANLLPNPNAPKEIDSSSDLYTNIITNYTPPTNEGPYKCPKCFKGFHKKNLLKKHKKNCRPRLQKDLLTRCKTCSRIFKDRQSLAKHLVNYHSEYTCEICGVAVQSKCEIVSHIRFTHPGSPDLQCHCGQILRSRADLARHKADHRDSHVCQFCGDALPTKIKLKMHILSLHRKILSLSCGICLKLFETQHILKEHVRLVHGDQLQPLTSCTVCGKNYGSKWKTYDHLNKSHGRIFKACKACLDVFETERELQAHFEQEHLNTAAGTGGGGSKHNQQQQHQLSALQVQLKLEENTPVHSANVTDNENDEEEDDEGVEEDVEMPVLDDEDAEGKQKSTETKLQSVQNGFYRKQQPPPPVAISSVPENKLSLLEKRLLGRKISEEEQTSKSTTVAVVPKSNTNNNRRVNTNKNTLQETTEPPAPPPPATLLDKAAPIQVDAPTSSSSSTQAAISGDILQNSSKRTVYVNSNDPSLCEICLKVWPAKKHLWQHYIRCHKQVAATVCGICLKTNPSYSSLQTHLRDTHPHLLHGCGFGSNFICKICGRYHNASSKLKLHMAIHVGFTESALLVLDTNSNGSNSNLATDNKHHDMGRKQQQQQQQQQEQQRQLQQQSTSDNDEEEIIDEDGEEEYGEEVEEYEQDTETNNNQSGSDEIDENEEHVLLDDMVIVKNELPDHPDYESLIEEIEASSDEEEEDEETDRQHNTKHKYTVEKREPEEQEETVQYTEPKGEDAVQTTDNEDEESEEEEEEAVDNEEDDGEVLMENDMEQEMLKNMIGESLAVVHVKREKQTSDNEEEEEEDVEDEERSDTEYGEEVDVKLEVCSSVEELDDDEDDVDEDDDDEEWSTAQDDEEHRLQQQRLFDRRPEELDDAIRSISYEQCDSDDNMDGSNPGLYSDQLSTASGLTESELETAVGSIL